MIVVEHSVFRVSLFFREERARMSLVEGTVIGVASCRGRVVNYISVMFHLFG